MATTATLNGGPTGGLHATTTLIHSENPPQEETCRVESNSSFESGNDEILPNNVLPGDNHSGAWSACEGLDRSFDSESQAMDFRGSIDAKGKKRRKQSRPVRIPATEMPFGAREHGSLLSESAGTGSEGDEAGELSSERGIISSSETKSVSRSIKQEKYDDEEGLLLRPSSRQQLPLNLTGSGKYDHEDESGDGLQHCLLPGQASALTSCLNLQQSGINSSIETDKTEAAGQGTKITASPPLTRVVPGSGSPTISSRQQFSPPLFSLANSSPFSAIFPSASGNSVSYFQQQVPHSLNSVGVHPSSSGNPPPGTPNSTSSTGSNQNGQGGGSSSAVSGMPPHRIFNPEAYCDLCNKEFCNKYFLKTHKANKHGVYSEVSPASMTSNQILAAAISSAAPSSSSFLSISHGAASNPLSNPFSPCLPQQQQQQLQQTSTSTTSSSSLIKREPGTSNESAFTSTLPIGDKNGSSSNSGGSSSQHQRESYCELCQKEFCNKYFLKRHKAKIHGIPIPAEMLTGKGSSGSNSNPNSKSSRPGFSNGMGEGGKRLSEDAMSSLTSFREMALENLGLDLVTKQLEDSTGVGMSQRERDSQRDDIDNANSDESNAPTNSLNSFQSEVMSSGENVAGARSSPDNLVENPMFKLSSLELKPQQLGSVNAENTCQFCFREFPSQQLLRSHIIKKHRLLLQSAFPPFLLSFQSMPPTAFEDPLGESSAVLDSNGNTEVDYECNICSRSFQTIYLLRMHKSYFHPEADQDTETPDHTKMMPESSSIFTPGEGAKETNEKEDNEGDTDQGFDSDADVEAKYDTNGKTAAAIDIENRGEATSDSDDLRRLQTMIMELNRVSTSSVAWSPPLAGVSTSPTTSQYAGASSASSLVCPICSKEFYSSYFLQQHIQHYHSAGSGGASSSMAEAHAVRIKSESPLGEITSNVAKKSNNEPGNGSMSNSQSQKERLEGPMTDPTTGLPTNPAFLTPGPKGSGSAESPLLKSDSGSGGSMSGSSGGVKRPSPSLSRSYCTICHKELCNKYFMRTHMLKMHGISIESSTGLGGVTCDICNKELCSKYFLKVHKQNTHGIIEDGPSPPNPSTPGPPPQPLTNFPIVTPPIMNLTSAAAAAVDTGSFIGQPDMSPSLLPKDQSERYLNHFSEVCPLCGRRFRSSKWLKSHLQSDHGPEGRDKWKSIEKSLNLQRRSPKISKPGSNNNNNGSSMSNKSGGSGQSLGKSGSNCGSSGKPLSSKDNNKCALCGYSSSDTETLRSHIIKEHGSQLGATSHKENVGSTPFSEGSQGLVLDPLTMLFQKMEGGTNKLYRCSYCPFTTSLLVYLYAHERTHTGLANSVTNQAPLTPDAKCPFQCPMCFHTFSQPDAFQQHLIGHQMSGVLAPFFTPSAAAAAAAAASSSCQYSLLSTSSENDPGEGGDGLFPTLPLLNGSSGSSSLYMALNANKSSLHVQEEEDGNKTDKEDDSAAAADLTTRKRQRQVEEDEEEIEEGELSPTKRSKISRFCCTCCHARFTTRKACVSHIRQDHKGRRVVFKIISMKRRAIMMSNSSAHQHHQQTAAKPSFFRGKRQFRCRKCRFASSTYTSLMVHSKLQHSIIRPGFTSNHETEEERKKSTTKENENTPTSASSSGSMAVASESANANMANAVTAATAAWKMGNLPEGRGVPQDGAADGDFIMQGFLLTSSEEESSSSQPSAAHFVPSLVYLPVREKVSQSVRVSFSLTPT